MNLLLLPGLLCDRRRLGAGAAAARAVLRSAAIPDYSNATSLVAMAERVLADAPPTFALAGHSMGGRVALEIVRQAPRTVSSGSRCSIRASAPRPAGAAGEDEKARRLALLALARAKGMRAMAREWVRPMVHPERLADAALIETILDMFERRTPARIRRTDRGAARATRRDRRCCRRSGARRSCCAAATMRGARSRSMKRWRR